MSTKNISRSALEGGRRTYNKYERNQSHRDERSSTREWLWQVSNDPDASDDYGPAPRNPVRKEFTDKLNPCYRWLAKHAGRPWAKVFSELKAKFDTRTLSAWHIVNQHMLTEVEGSGAPVFSFGGRTFCRFYIDDSDILRDRGRDHWRTPRKKYTGPTEKQVSAWARGRGVIDYGTVQFWAEPTRDGLNVIRGWRQTTRFTKEDAAYWATVPHRLQKLWICGPG
jgi:hypothetical protein